MTTRQLRRDDQIKQVSTEPMRLTSPPPSRRRMWRIAAAATAGLCLLIAGYLVGFVDGSSQSATVNADQAAQATAKARNDGPPSTAK